LTVHTVAINSECCRTWSEQVKNGDFENGCRWFQIFFIDFQLFYFLARIIPVYISSKENYESVFPIAVSRSLEAHYHSGQ